LAGHEANPKPITIPEFMSKTVDRFPNNPALVYQDLNSKKWITITYKEYKAKVEKVAKAFIKLGLMEQESVAVLAFNSPEWFITELATQHAG
jgi:long-chain-fatty-acid--CoA ligase ACSBG